MAETTKVIITKYDVDGITPIGLEELPSADTISQSVITDLTTDLGAKLDASAVTTDGTLGGYTPSDTLVPSESAVQEFVGGAVSAIAVPSVLKFWKADGTEADITLV